MSDGTRIALFCVVVALGHPGADELRWRNGSTQPGTLLEMEIGQLRWSIPSWDAPWELDTAALDSITFHEPKDLPLGNYRLRTISGDLLLVDAEGADTGALRFGSPVLGSLRIRPDALRSLERVEPDNTLFLATSYHEWLRLGKGPIRNLRYRVYEMDPDWENENSPLDVSGLDPIREGSLPEGRIDFGVTRWDGPRAIVFEGEYFVWPVLGHRGESYSMEVDRERHYLDQPEPPVWSRLTVGEDEGGVVTRDSRPNADPRQRSNRSLFFESGWHPLKFEHVGAGRDCRVLVHFQPSRRVQWISSHESGWGRLTVPEGPLPPGWGSTEQDGHLITTGRSTLLRGMELPESFDLELDLASSLSPRFVFGFGLSTREATSIDAFRVETWDEGLVVTRGEAFVPLRILEPSDREIRLHLDYDGDRRHLEIRDSEGKLLAEWKGVSIAPGPSGICLVNEGRDLTVRRIRLARRTPGLEFINLHRNGVRLTDGQVLSGVLRHDPSGGGWVVDSGSDRKAVDPLRLDRVVTTTGVLPPDGPRTVLIYGNGMRVRGELLEVASDTVTLRTGFAEEPVVCSLDGLENWRFASGPDESASGPVEHSLTTPEHRIWGRLMLEEGKSPLRWLPSGGLASVPVSDRIRGRFESARTAGKGRNSGDDLQMIYLDGGEFLAGRILSCDEEQMVVDVPLAGRRTIPVSRINALEMDDDPARPGIVDRSSAWSRSGIRLIDWIDSPFRYWHSAGRTFGSFRVAMKIGEAIRRPLHRTQPHLLVIRNEDVRSGDDVEQGMLLAVDDGTVRFGTPEGERTLKRDMLRQVIRITGAEPTDPKGGILAVLENGSRLFFESMESDGEQLILRSGDHGRFAIPLEDLRQLHLGGFQEEFVMDPYAPWTIRPKEGRASGK